MNRALTLLCLSLGLALFGCGSSGGGDGDDGGPPGDDGGMDAGTDAGDGGSTPETVTVTMTCGQNASAALVPFPIEMAVTPAEVASDGQAFTADISSELVLGQDFLQGAAETLASLFNLGLTEVDIMEGQIQFDALEGATCTPVLSEIPGPFPITLPIPNDGSGSIPTVITGGVTISLFPDVTISCTAGDAPGPYAICPDGNRADPFSFGTATTETFVRIVAGGIPVSFDCEPGAPNDNGTPDDDSDDFADPIDPATDCPSFPIAP